jgi:hypothetical protein
VQHRFAAPVFPRERRDRRAHRLALENVIENGQLHELARGTIGQCCAQIAKA